MNIVDLFCGCGGFSLGAHNAGFDVVSAYDFDEVLTSSFRKNFPDTNLFHRDIATLTGEEVGAGVDGNIDGIIGGPPCQGFSDIGRRSTDDPRRDLLGHFFRIVSEVKPLFFVMENVRGLAYQGALPVLEKALSLVSPSYDILGPHILDASEFGAATKRRRLFIIGIHKNVSAPIPLSTIDRFKRPAANVKAAIADLGDAHEQVGREFFARFDLWKIRRRGRPSNYARALRSIDGIFTSHKPTSHTPAVAARFANVKPGNTDLIGRHTRLQWEGVCPTLRAGTGSDKGSYQAVRPIHPSENRVITVREAARLQGFPDNHVFHPTVWHSFRMIGNSVSPIMAEALFKAIATHFRHSGLFENCCANTTQRALFER
ncbi:MAG: DNA (cytosine-5-)-methyltransferase [Xanthomonadales bacterium]|nr:DNA (cytosine-5-)-methyltransferase [Xanthomonadales bacterium]|tara:strand:+ start:141 stop:1259 length:1119 start_codon:yes stop_codon:yes gene_type:complete